MMKIVHAFFLFNMTLQLRYVPFSPTTNPNKEKRPAASYYHTGSPISRLLVHTNTAVNRACASQLEMAHFWSDLQSRFLAPETIIEAFSSEATNLNLLSTESCYRYPFQACFSRRFRFLQSKVYLWEVRASQSGFFNPQLRFLTPETIIEAFSSEATNLNLLITESCSRHPFQACFSCRFRFLKSKVGLLEVRASQSGFFQPIVTIFDS